MYVDWSRWASKMRVFLYTILGLPLLFADGVLLYSIPATMRFSSIDQLILLGGAVLYLCLHFLVRKPERMYLWAHEFTHLLVAKLFLRQVHSFHITSRSGGKVVIDRTNVAIDLAPYAVPFYNVVAVLPITLSTAGGGYGRKIYLGIAAFLFAMHLCFSAEGFLDGQPDVRRSGRVFSLAVILLVLMCWAPLFAAPATPSGFSGVPSFYREWLGKGMRTASTLLLRGRALL